MAASTDRDHNDKEEDQATVFSWRPRDRLNPNFQQSQWLQATLSDLDKKTKAMLNIMQDDGDSFAKRAEMYYQKRPELVQMVEDLHKSYRSLAENYDKLKSESLGANHRKLLSSWNSLAPLAQQHQIPSFQKENQIEEPADDNSNLSQVVNKSVKFVEFCLLEGEQMRINEVNGKMSKLVEDNLREQAELIRRNDEKREVIKELGYEINRLMDENRALKTRCLENYRKSRLRKLFCIRF